MASMRFSLLYFILQINVPISFFYFYRRTKTVRFQSIPKRAPLIFASNHQNTLTDPFVIGNAVLRQTYFLARASAFKKPFAARILKSLKMKPIYRPRDGMENLSKNDEVFKACFDVLSCKQSLNMYPEGTHNRIRHLRLFKKGFSRIALGAYEESKGKLKIKIFPIGINYSDHLYQGGDLLVNIGKPIDVENFYETYLVNQPKAINDLKNEVYRKIRELMIHIQDLDNYDAIDKLREITRKDVLQRLQLKQNKLYDQFTADKKTIEIVEKQSLTEPEATASLYNMVKAYQTLLKKLYLKDRVFESNMKMHLLLFRSILLLLLFPFFLFSFLNSFLPYYFIKYIIRYKVNDDHFYSSFKMAIAMFLFPIFYLIISIPVFYNYGIYFGLLYYISLFITAKLAFICRQLFRTLRLDWRYWSMRFSKNKILHEAIAKRYEIRSAFLKLADEYLKKKESAG